MGGYNTACEILATDTPALVVPRETPTPEQLIRARALRDAGARVIGALVVAATPPPVRRRGSTVPGGPVPEPDDQIAIGSRR